MKKNGSVAQNRLHFSDPDYGVNVSEKLGRILVRLSYIDETGATRSVSPTWTFHSAASRTTVESKARKERDRLLALPEFQAYLSKTYADPTGELKKNLAKPFSNKVNKNATIPNLNGLFVKLYTKPAKLDGRPMTYLNIMAHAPGPEGKPRYRSLSIRKHGLHGALTKAAQYRSEKTGAALPSPSELAKAEAAIRKTYKAYLQDNT